MKKRLLRTQKRLKADDFDSTVKALLPLYSSAEEDRADSIVGSYPNTVQIVRAFKALMDVIFPGKMSPDAVLHHRLDVFLRERLGEALRLLQPKLERALPFRWIGEAARIEGPPPECDVRKEAEHVLAASRDCLPGVRKLLIEDVHAAYEGGPAVLTYTEVQRAYPSLLAITSHRLAHGFY